MHAFHRLKFVTPDKQTATLLFVDGTPSKIATTAPVAYLGRVLVDLGLLSSEAYDQSLRELAGARKLHGQLLTESGLVSPEQVSEALREQLARKLSYIFSLPPETRYAYYDGFDAIVRAGGGEMTPVDPMPLVWRAVRENTPHAHMETSLAKIGDHLVRIASDAKIDRFGLDGPALELIELLRSQPMRLADMGAMGMLHKTSLDQLLYCLLITKQLQLVKERRSRPSASGDVGSARPAQSAGPASAGREKEIIERSESIEREDYFAMLGLTHDATPEEVRAAYFGLAKNWHPDRLPADLTHVREACGRVFSHMSEAHATLSDADRRTEYMRLLRDGGATPESQAVILRVIEAATTFQKAEICMNSNDLAQAEALCRRANELDANQGDYVALLAWLEAQKPDNQSGKATLECIAHLDRAIALNERCERAYFYRGLLRKRLGDMTSAVRDFRTTAELNPRNIDAVREVRLYGMRRPAQEPTRSSGGLFDRLFKK
jgi:tetratricopeptide (TPR) repeat protein